MRKLNNLFGFLGLLFLVSPLCYGATISGTVKGPDGAPYEGAFVQAQNAKTKITTIVLSDGQGHYQLEKLPAGEYRITLRALGLSADPKSGVNLTADQKSSMDFGLQKGTVRWNDISIYQLDVLAPAGDNNAKQQLFTKCFICHGFQTRMAAVKRDQDGWKDRVQFMRDAMHFSLTRRVTDADADTLATYLYNMFGTDSKMPKSPADMPAYAATVQKYTSDADKIVYVEYDMPGPSRMPFSAAPDKDGYFWIPNFGIANKITRLDTKTGEMTDFPAPNVGTAAVHSAYPFPDGSVWLAEQGSNKLGRWDPKTQKITEYQDDFAEGATIHDAIDGSRHTVRFDPAGNAWATGSPLTKYDPETGKFTNFWDLARQTYGVELGPDGNMWFTRQDTNQVGKIDWKTNKGQLYNCPTPKCFPRRLAVDSDGTVWFAEFNGGKIGKLDPNTGNITEYVLPGPEATPYGFGIAADHTIWYSSYNKDVMGHFDPKTGKVVEYPFPHSENTIRELFLDKQGRMWYGSPSNNKVGYFYLTGNGGSERAAK
jgi:virginiamycin B lyase